MRVDLEKLRTNVESTAELLRSDPSAGHVRPRVSTRLVENVNARSEFIQYDKEFAFECDESEGRAGSGSAPSPLRYFLSGLAFCQQVWYAKGAALVGCEIEDLEIDVVTYMDMRGEHLIDGIAPHPQWIVITADVATPGTAEQVLALVDEANSRCPVYNLVARAVPIYERISRNGVVVRNTVPEGLDE
ncbi:MAG: OsmC family protein [Acidimicrobiia bacterium]|nr:OsmC family protein [Acidimicrobiia bacterium]